MVQQKRSINKGNIILLISSLFVIVLLVEGSLYILDAFHFSPRFFKAIFINYPMNTRTGEGLYYAHPYTSYATQPGYVRENWSTINSLGFRGKEITRKKSPGVYRIVTLGASTTYGIYQSDNYTYPILLEAELKKKLNTNNLEVVNAGLVSATTAESLNRLFVDILPLNPDMIIIYHGFNDLIPRIFNDFSDDYYHFRKIPLDKTLLTKSYLYRLCLRVFAPATFSEHHNLLSYIWKFENFPAAERKRIENFNKTSSAIFERNLDYLITMVLAKRISVVLSTFAIHKDAPSWNPYLPQELSVRGIEENNQATRKLAVLYHLPLIDFYNYAITDKRMFQDEIHMNRYGNVKKANFFAKEVLPIIEKIISH